MLIKRHQEKNIKKYSEKYPVIFVTGPRQSGKTTICKTVFPKYAYQNLEDPQTRLIASTDPRSFLSQSNRMIIDEIQRVPELLSYIQVISDSDSKKKFVITGSQNILISEKISQSLAGRVAIFNLLPFSLKEIQNTQFKSKDNTKLMLKGFYPRIYDRKLDPVEWYKNYIQTYLERDIREIKNIVNLIDFQRFLKLCAGRTGQILNLSSLSNDVGVSVNTIKGWLSVLEATFIIHLLPPFFKNFNKRIVKSPKIYFLDSGLACSLLDIKNTTQLQTHPLIGNIFETFCISEILKLNYNTRQNLDLYYFRDKLGNEIDLVYEKENTLNALEIKSSKTFTTEFIKNLMYFEKVSDRPVVKKLILQTDKATVYKDIWLDNVENISL